MISLVRQLKLNALVGQKASADDRVGRIVTFFDDMFDGLQLSIIPEYRTDKFLYHKGGKFYMEQDKKNIWLECRWEGYWSFFKNDLGLEYEDIQVIIKFMMEKYLNGKVGIPGYQLLYEDVSAENNIKHQVGIPCIWTERVPIKIEEHVNYHSPQ